MGGFSVKIDGFEEVSRKLLKLSDKIKRRKLLAIQRKAAKPMLRAIKNATPKADKNVVRRTKDGNVADTFDIGNLEESMAIITGRKGKSRINPVIYIGPGVGKKKKFDGYYGFFIIKGTRSIAPNDFINRAAAPLVASTQKGIEDGILALLKREKRKLGLGTSKL